MDIRTTLPVNGTFLEMLVNCRERNEKAAMLLDSDGMNRAEGLIKAIYPDAPKPYLKLVSGTRIDLETIVAVNGVFSPSFSEC
jgi:hypothetical protein